MSQDEWLVLAICVALLGFLARPRVTPLWSLSRLVTPVWIRLVVVSVLVVSLGVVHGTLLRMSAWDVQSSDTYIAYYDLMGVAWLGLALVGMEWLGLSLRDDVLERRNVAALVALSGALVGHALAYSGGNIGEGPGWWCVVWASGLASLALFGVWLLLHVVARVPELVTVERDLPTAIRAAGLLAGCGLIFGRAAAGDWISFEETVVSFAVVASPAVLVVGPALGAEQLLRPSRPVRARLAVSVALSVSYAVASVGIVHFSGATV